MKESGDVPINYSEVTNIVGIRRTALMIDRIDDAEGQVIGARLRQGYYCVDDKGQTAANYPAGELNEPYFFAEISPSIVEMLGGIDLEASNRIKAIVLQDIAKRNTAA